MRQLLILGGGTAGTMVANKLRRRLNRTQWQITVVDRDAEHLYQPGLLFVPFGGTPVADLTRPRRRVLAPGVVLVHGEIERVDPERSTVTLAGDRELPYDYLVIATGTAPRPDQTPGLLGPHWRRTIHDFYTPDGAVALARALPTFDAGRLVVHIVDVPIKCPVAPLEFTFLADAYLRRRGVRDRVELTYVTPLPGAFTKPIASRRLGGLLRERGVAVEPDFLAYAAGRPMTVRFDGHANCFVESGDGRALLIDFNYDTEPLPGRYPLPGVGPFDLLAESRRNHLGKLAFRWLYWHALLPGRPLPLPAHMSMAGKHGPDQRGEDHAGTR